MKTRSQMEIPGKIPDSHADLLAQTTALRTPKDWHVHSGSTIHYNMHSHRVCALSSWESVARVKYVNERFASIDVSTYADQSTESICTGAIKWYPTARDAGRPSKPKHN
jgi:hypothetical protein